MTNLKSNCDILESCINFNKRNTRAADYLISIMRKQPPFVDTMEILFHRARLEPSTQIRLSQEGYEMLKNEGFDIKKELSN